MKSSNHLHIARLMSECPPPACPEHLWKGVSHTTLETLNPAEQGDAFSAPGWKQVPRACTVFRTLAGGRGCVHAHMLLPARGSAAWPAFPWAGHRATAEEREAPALTRARTFHAHRASTPFLRCGLRERVCLVSDCAAGVSTQALVGLRELCPCWSAPRKAPHGA